MSDDNTANTANKIAREGFWKSDEEPELPLPISSAEGIDNIYRILDKFNTLRMITKYGTQDEQGNPTFDCKYSYSNLQWTQYMGYSHCRLGCTDDRQMGDTTITLVYNDKVYEFPDGYRHYIDYHNVRPSSYFCDMMMNFEPKQVRSLTKEEKFTTMVSLNIYSLMQGSRGLRYS